MGVTVVIVNPYHVKKAKELDDNSPTKSDRKDALTIANLVWQGRFSRCYLPEGVWAELRGYTKSRSREKAKLNAAKNNLVAVLDEYFPEYMGVFKNLLGKASLYILTNRPFPVDLRQLTEEELANELRTASRGRMSVKQATILLAAAHRSIGMTEGLNAARLRLSQCLSEIKFREQRLEQVEAAMATALAETGLGEYLLSIPGVGVVTAAGLLGEVGDLSRYDDWRQIRKMAGYNLIENSSGQHKGRTKISKRGRPILRNILYQAALVLVSKNVEFKALYQYLKNRRQNRLKVNKLWLLLHVNS